MNTHTKGGREDLFAVRFTWDLSRLNIFERGPCLGVVVCSQLLYLVEALSPENGRARVLRLTNAPFRLNRTLEYELSRV